MRSGFWVLVWLAVLFGLGLALWDYARKHPENLPWTELDLRAPQGIFTGRKIAALTQDADQCRKALDQADISYNWLPSVQEGQCGYADGVRLLSSKAFVPEWRPSGLGISCPVAAGLVIWERDVQEAALRHFGSRVARFDHLGSYNCRRLYGRSEGEWSEHATADAVDISGFRLADGTAISIVRDWDGPPEKAAFLREVRDGACGLFSTVLSPDYNAAHADHFHLDQAERGRAGYRVCR